MRLKLWEVLRPPDVESKADQQQHEEEVQDPEHHGDGHQLPLESVMGRLDAAALK